MAQIPALRHLCQSFIAKRHIRVGIERLPHALILEFITNHCIDSLLATSLATILFPDDAFLQRISGEAANSRVEKSKVITKNAPIPLSATVLPHQRIRPLKPIELLTAPLDRGHLFNCSNGNELCSVIVSRLSVNSVVVLQLPHQIEAMLFKLGSARPDYCDWRIASYEVNKFQLWATYRDEFIYWIIDPLLAGSEQYIESYKVPRDGGTEIRFIGEVPYVLTEAYDAFLLTSLDGKRVYNSTDEGHGPLIRVLHTMRPKLFDKKPQRLVTVRRTPRIVETFKWTPVKTAQLKADPLDARVWLQSSPREGSGFVTYVYSEE